ncbi:MAG: oxygenase MpaB family protein [Nocardioides sp.]
MPGIKEQLGHALFLRFAGPDGPKHRERIHGRPGPRWFDPASPIGRVHGDAAMFVGGIRAVLLQTLHPSAMTAVAEHSGYRGDMWGRLARTSRFIAVTTFGTASDAQQAVDMVRTIHERVTGVTDDGTPYAASDPHLLAWVHLAEVHSFLLAHQTYGREPLDQAGRDEYVAQTAEVARRLGVIDPPTTEAGLDEALAAFRPELRVTAAAREAVSYLLWRPPLPVPVRPAYGVLMAVAIGLMPAWSRRPLRLPWVPVTGPVVTKALGTAATATIRWALAPPPVETSA